MFVALVSFFEFISVFLVLFSLSNSTKLLGRALNYHFIPVLQVGTCNLQVVLEYLKCILSIVFVHVENSYDKFDYVVSIVYVKERMP